MLRRELLSMPHIFFHFMGEFQGVTVQWRESARREVRCMANLVCYMYCHVGSKWCSWLFVTDAMGENEHDHGRFGICATELRPGEFHTLLRHGEAPGLTVARLDSVGGARHPEKMLQPTVPFIRLPDKYVQDDRWKVVEVGRWQFGDHITIGESRTVVLVQLLRRL